MIYFWGKVLIVIKHNKVENLKLKSIFYAKKRKHKKA